MINYLRKLISKIKKDDIFTQSAALALYTSFSLAPLLILLISFLSSLQLDLQLQLVEQVKNLVGSEAANVLTAIIEKAEERKDLSTLSGWIGSLTLLFSASVIFAHLQGALNKIFHTPPMPHDNKHWTAELRRFISKRLISFGIVLSFIFISIVSLMASSLLSLVMGSQEGLFGELVNIGLSLVLFTILFSAIFKWMPDKSIPNRAVLRAGFLTGILFMVGKTLIGIYLGQTAVGSAYGAAGSFIVLLLWVYYSSLIIFVGAEIAAIRLDSDPLMETEKKKFSLHFPKAIPRWALATIATLVIFRMLLPPICLLLINRTLEKKLGHYVGHIDDFDLSLYRGAYQLQGLEVKKRDSTLPPLLKAEEIDLALAWRALFRREITANVEVHKLHLQFIHGSAKQMQSGLEEDEKNWQSALEVLVPIHIESLKLEESSIFFTENKLKSPVSVRLEKVRFEATDLRTKNKEVASPFYLEGILQGHAPLKVAGKLDILSRPPRGHVGIELEKFKIATLNRLLLLYVPVDITKGEMSLYGEATTSKANAKGYVKFFLTDGDIIANTQDFVSGKHFALEIFSALGNWVLKNNKTRKVAAHIPFEYVQGKLNIDASEAFWSAVKNRWDEIKPGLDQPHSKNH